MIEGGKKKSLKNECLDEGKEMILYVIHTVCIGIKQSTRHI